MNKSKKLAYLQMSKKPPRPVTKPKDEGLGQALFDGQTPTLRCERIIVVDDPSDPVEALSVEDMIKVQGWYDNKRPRARYFVIVGGG